MSQVEVKLIEAVNQVLIAQKELQDMIKNLGDHQSKTIALIADRLMDVLDRLDEQ